MDEWIKETNRRMWIESRLTKSPAHQQAPKHCATFDQKLTK